MAKTTTKEKEKKKEIKVSYDNQADVLYISFGKPKAAISVEVDDGDLVRVDPFTDETVGITIIDFKARYLPKENDILSSARAVIPLIIKRFKAQIIKNRQSAPQLLPTSTHDL